MCSAGLLPLRAKSVSRRMLACLVIHGVAVFRLSRKISDTASSGRVMGAPLCSTSSRSRRRVVLPVQSIRSSARTGPEDWGISRCSLSSSSTAAVRTCTSSRADSVSANRSSSAVWRWVYTVSGSAAAASSSWNATASSSFSGRR